MIKFPQRSFYFAQLAPINKNIDFPLNLGYNDHYTHHAQYRGSLAQRLSLKYRRTSLELQFKRHYLDLLQAICNQSYDSLQVLCENELL
jgi:hypothetical protein